MGSITEAERDEVRRRSPLGSRYDVPVDRESAFEILAKRAAQAAAPAAEEKKSGEEKQRGRLGEILWGTGRRQGMVETFAKQTMRTVGSQVGRSIFRGLLGGITGRR